MLMRLACFVLVCGTLGAKEPCVSGPTLGQKPGPYSFLVASGAERGQQTCYVCETGEKPGIIVFARSLSEPLAKVLAGVDRTINAQPKDAVRGWLTVLGEKTVSLDDLGAWAKQAGLKSVPTGVFDDTVGPPSYKLSDDADVTVLLFKNKKVVANFAYRKGELTPEALKKIEEELGKLPTVEKK